MATETRIWIHGRACVFDSPTDDDRPIPWTVKKGAFDFIDVSDPETKLTINHETDLVTVADGCLSIRLADSGVFFSADLPDCSGSRKLKQDIDSGRYSGASIDIVGVTQYRQINGKRTQEFVHVDAIRDVAIVTAPGNSRCYVSAHRLQMQPRTRAAAASTTAGKTRKRKRTRNPALAARMRQHQTALQPIAQSVGRFASRQGLTVRELMAKATAGPLELTGSHLYEPNGKGGWNYLGR